MNVIATIEDLLEVAAGMTRNPEPKIKLDKEDITIMHSIARQVFKGTALTDRQFALMQEKLSKYKDQFEESCDFDSVVVELRKPLREIDRSKYIKIADYPEDTPYHLEDAGKFIEVRFPFRKTDIMLINEISNQEGYYHSKGSHKHFFTYTEQNVYNILSRFVQKDFDIDKELIDVYNNILDIRSKKTDFISCIVDNKIYNLNPKAKLIAEREIGEFNSTTKLCYIDRARRYGISFVDIPQHQQTLQERIAYRKENYYHSSPTKESLDEILQSLWNLKRFPLLVILDKTKAEHQLHELVTYYRDILPNEEQSVLFRLDGASGFNQLIKDRNLNNWVDINTKIVYISNDKLPKLLVNNEWQPVATFSYTSSLDRTVNSFVENRCDLIVYREDTLSPMRKYSKFYG